MSCRTLGVSAHRLDVELLQPVLDPLERRRIGTEHPLEQRGEEAGAVQRAGVAGAGHAAGEFLQHRDGIVVGGDHPVLADDALERDQLSLVALVRRIGGDVDVAAVVLEDGAVLRVGEALAGGAVEPERFCDAARVLLGAAIDVDPDKLPAAQPLGALGEIIEALDLVAVEDDRFGHCRSNSTGAVSVTARCGRRPP